MFLEICIVFYNKFFFLFFIDDKPHRYGQQRLYGALGWGILSGVTGFIIDAASEGKASKNYIYAFYLGAFFMLLDAAVSWNIKVSLGN